MMRTILLILTIIFSMTAHGENHWQRSVINYSRQDYRSGNQNWMVAQNREGWMYFANNKGLLEFDGSTWTTYPLPGNTKLRAVRAIGDTIYVGALGQFGRFVRNEKGKLTYQRLSEKVEKPGAMNVWHIHQIGQDIYFQSDQALYINNGKNEVECLPGINYSNVVYHRLYIASSRGLFVMVGNQFQRLQGIDINQISTIIGVFPYQGKLLIVTNDKGLYLYENSQLTPFSTAADEQIRQGRLSCASLYDGLLALGTMQDGVILLNLTKNTAERMSIANGLQNKTVLSTAFDKDQNLWLGLDNGIDCIPLQSPLRFLNSRLSPVGSGYCSQVYNGKLYLGTNQGLYVMDRNASDSPIRFIDGTGSQVLCLDTIDGRLYCGGRRFFLMVDGDRITRFPHRGVWGVRSVGYRKDILLTGSYWGLRLMRLGSSGWQVAEDVKGTDISAKTLYIEDGSGAVWAANKEKGLFRMTLTEDLKEVKSQKCMNSPELPKGDNVCVARIDGVTVVASRQGLFRYDSTHDRLERYTELEQKLGGRAAYTYIRQAPSGDIWYASDGTMHLCSGKRNDAFLNDYLIEDFESVSLIENGQRAVIGTEEGFASLRIGAIHANKTQIKPYIRKIYIGNNADTLYYGNQQPVRIDWIDNSLRLEYSANNYDPTQTVLYSFQLEGSDDKEWSPYTRRRIKEYTHLAEGNYTFRLRIITTGSSKPVETSFSFTILPPWYRTWWAYTLYILCCIAFAYYANKRLQKSRKQLIMQKDEQIHEKEEQIETLREEKLEIELRSRQDELVRSRMNIVRKNEMLQEIKKTAVSLNNSLSEENLSASKRRIVRLIGQIDTNIEHDDDLEAFKGSFDAVHHDFFKTLDERFPELSYKEKMLCAYIRMNLMSKEIAPLLNISTRGVEISRYRIRKKLGLDEKANLAEYLQHLAP